MKGVTDIKSFADWFSDRRRQVAYKTFVSRVETQNRLKSIPQPSQTRWLFYGDVIASILSQRRHVEDFIKTQECFPSFWTSLLKKEKYEFPNCYQFSFENRHLCTLFLFVDYILGLLGRVSKHFQQRYLMIWEAWSVVKSFEKHLMFVTTKLQQDQPSFTFLSSLNQEQKQELVSVVQQLHESLNMRFPCPSTSCDKRRKSTTTTMPATKDDTQERDPFLRHCSISALFDVLSFHQSGETPTCSTHPHHRQLMLEIEMVGKEIEQHQEIHGVLLEKNRHITSSVGYVVEVQVSLQDVFHFVSKERYPILWRENVKMKTLIPTTVSCEQSFSLIKHTLHNNKSMKTVFANVTAKYDATREFRKIE